MEGKKIGVFPSNFNPFVKPIFRYIPKFYAPKKKEVAFCPSFSKKKKSGAELLKKQF